jgi:hypothetical protein
LNIAKLKLREKNAMKSVWNAKELSEMEMRATEPGYVLTIVGKKAFPINPCQIYHTTVVRPVETLLITTMMIRIDHMRSNMGSIFLLLPWDMTTIMTRDEVLVHQLPE